MTPVTRIQVKDAGRKQVVEPPQPSALRDSVAPPSGFATGARRQSPSV
jgi:hypothetical protein